MRSNQIALSDYFQLLNDKEILQITFLEGYFQIIFDRGGMNCFSETFIKTSEGIFQIPSKEGVWQLINLIGKKMLSVEQKENEILMFIDNGTEIAVNTKLGPAGDTFHIVVEGHSTLHY